jgi:hypothetical protein
MEALLAAFPLKHKRMQTVLLASEIGRLMAWDGNSKNAVNTHFGKVGEIRRAFDYMGALTIDNLFRSVILATLKSSNNHALRTSYDQILDDLDEDKDLTFPHIQTICARQFRRTNSAALRPAPSHPMGLAPSPSRLAQAFTIYTYNDNLINDSLVNLTKEHPKESLDLNLVISPSP